MASRQPSQPSSMNPDNNNAASANASADASADASANAQLPMGTGVKHDRLHYPIAASLAASHANNVYSHNARELNKLMKYDNTDVEETKKCASVKGTTDYIMKLMGEASSNVEGSNGFASAIGNTDYEMSAEDIDRFYTEKAEFAYMFRVQGRESSRNEQDDIVYRRQTFASFNGKTTKEQKLWRMIDEFERKLGGGKDHFTVVDEMITCDRCKKPFKAKNMTHSILFFHVNTGCRQGRSKVEDHIYKYEKSEEGEVGLFIPSGDNAWCTFCEKTIKQTSPGHLRQHVERTHGVSSVILSDFLLYLQAHFSPRISCPPPAPGHHIHIGDTTPTPTPNASSIFILHHHLSFWSTLILAELRSASARACQERA
eukprot:scaffold40008_cov69-Cyclotella_meneghiniana.AAC.1